MIVYQITKMPKIEVIDKGSVHRICSGQVVLNLATAVKELIENSLDAGATTIEIKLKDYGSTSIEVTDDGSGVEEDNFAGLTLKHHTSKIADFSDLTSVETFGFRGEALSSLCALSHLAICTRHKESKVGHKIKYCHSGKILSKTPCARLVGTTVTIEKLFSTLPVRHKEFQKHLKREFKKLLSMLNAYCVISTGVRASCSNQNNAGKRTTIVSTNGSDKILDNISNVFGKQDANSLIEFKQAKPSEEACETFFLDHTNASEKSETFVITGYISRCNFGRSSTDRQLFFVNSRPCDLPKAAKVINDAFHVFDRHHYPFIVLNICARKETVDVNVTPDKRQVFLENEKVIFTILKTSILKLYEGSNGHDIGSTFRSKSSFKFKQEELNRSEEETKPLSDINSCEDINISTQSSVLNNNSLILNKSPSSNGIASTDNGASNSVSFLSKFKSLYAKNENCFSNVKQSNSRKRTRTSDITSFVMPKQAKIEEETPQIDHLNLKNLDDKISPEIKVISLIEKQVPDHQPDDTIQNVVQHEDTKPEYVLDTPCHGSDDVEIVDTFDKEYKFSIKKLKERLKFKKDESRENSTILRRNFKSNVQSASTEVEAELNKNLTKKSFLEMEVIGQFNLGFIIAKYNNDVFIIDQHASDEKYNFEMLQRNCDLKGQRLIVPQKLEITAADIMVLEENMNILERNGFIIDIKLDEDNKQAAYLVSVPPVTNNYTFGASDVHEVIFMLNDMPGVMCRPSKVRQMFASKACRKSIMIGTALSKSEMTRLIRHMETMDQPWNCPHGRPTMRHLVDLNMISTTEDLT